MSAHLLRYATWQARDYVAERGLGVLVIAALLLFPPVMALRASGGPTWVARPDAALLASRIFVGVLPPLIFIGTFFATHGIVANDRGHGYFRFLFAKPVAIPAYYAQAFTVHLLGLVVAIAVVQALFSLLFLPLFVPGALAYAAAHFVALGGIVLLCSALARFDWLIALGLWVAGDAVRQYWPASESAVGAVLGAVLPPSHLAGAMSRQLAGPMAVDVSALLWFVGYGAVAFALGLVILGRRAFAT